MGKREFMIHTRLNASLCNSLKRRLHLSLFNKDKTQTFLFLSPVNVSLLLFFVLGALQFYDSKNYVRAQQGSAVGSWELGSTVTGWPDLAQKTTTMDVWHFTHALPIRTNPGEIALNLQIIKKHSYLESVDPCGYWRNLVVLWSTS